MTEKGEPPWAKVCMGDKKNKVSEVGRPLVTLFCIDHGKRRKSHGKSWKKHGLWFRETAGNPVNRTLEQGSRMYLGRIKLKVCFDFLDLYARVRKQNTDRGKHTQA